VKSEKKIADCVLIRSRLPGVLVLEKSCRLDPGRSLGEQRLARACAVQFCRSGIARPAWLAGESVLCLVGGPICARSPWIDRPTAGLIVARSLFDRYLPDIEATLSDRERRIFFGCWLCFSRVQVLSRGRVCFSFSVVGHFGCEICVVSLPQYW
jgi:hypothetical protein